MKKKIAILLSCVCIAFPALTYAQSNIQVKLDGSYVKFSGQEPTVINNRTMVPLRGIFENLGYSIEWDANTKTATLNKDNKSISIQTGADRFSVNGVGKELDVPAYRRVGLALRSKKTASLAVKRFLEYLQYR